MSTKRGYELYLVINGELEEEVRESTIERVTQLIESQDGDILKAEERGKRRLAYPIEGQLEGYDVLYEFLMPPSGPNVVENQLRLSEQILRYLLLRRDELLDTVAEEATSGADTEHTTASVEEGEAEPAIASEE